MKLNIYKKRNMVIIMFLFFSVIYGQNNKRNSLAIDFNKKAEIEVGGHYVGAEFHKSYPLPQRISFYYPVANSIDLSTDFWHRDTSFVMAAGLAVDGKKQWIDLNGYGVSLTPYSVQFKKRINDVVFAISYHFANDKPAMIVEYNIKNISTVSKDIEFYTRLETSLHTSHTFALKDKAATEYDGKHGTIYADYDDKETMDACIFTANAGEMPVSYNTISDGSDLPEPGSDYWLNNNGKLQEQLADKQNPGKPAAEFLYKKKLAPGAEMNVVQITGSSKQDEAKSIVDYLTQNYQKEINAYEKYVTDAAFDRTFMNTTDTVFEKTIRWARAMLETNKHYIDGDITPMPCPAEYNFYFTHDVLVTDLAAVNFDLTRVKNDLSFIIKHANSEKIIPHAYYWKDSSFATEFADHDNWNNFWFVIVTASYLRHSADSSFAAKLYPYAKKCLSQAMLTKGDDDLMWSYRPDWWDIGHLYGQRSYMTILAIKAIRSFVYLSAAIDKNIDKLHEWETLADKMNAKLVNKLWDDKVKYLMNYNEPGTEDMHYYIGSLLAPYYGLLDSSKANELLNTAKEKLLDKKVGVYNAYPMDFHKLTGYYHFVDDEAGQPYYYMNGGIWPQGNAWYALSLISAGRYDEAESFIKTTMTIDGIMKGPNGQPAMYEVRNGNKDNPEEYGKVDKPQFMWSAGWYLYTLYNLFGAHENDWNISIDRHNKYDVDYSLYVSGKRVSVDSDLRDNSISHSAVIPSDIPGNVIINKKDITGKPYLINVNSILEKCEYSSDQKEMKIALCAFPGHKDSLTMLSRTEPVEYDGNAEIISEAIKHLPDGMVECKITFIHKTKNTIIEVKY